MLAFFKRHFAARGRAPVAGEGAAAWFAQAWWQALSPKAMLFVAAAAVTITGTTTPIGHQIVAAGQTAVMDAADLIRKRSPGARRVNSLTKMKGKAALDTPRFARALPAVRTPMALAAAPVAPIAEILPSAFPALIEAPVPVVQGAFAPLPFPFFNGPGGGLVFPFPPIGGGGGGGGGGGVIVVPPGPPPGPPPAIPEPATWVTLILGFGMIGGTIRHSRAARGKNSRHA